jgi:hypothetical protein
MNASFEVMDIRAMLVFPDQTFDMVNTRYLFAVLRGDEWTTFIKECMRILRIELHTDDFCAVWHYVSIYVASYSSLNVGLSRDIVLTSRYTTATIGDKCSS